MRLGAYPRRLVSGTKISDIFSNKPEISERHRHRYEVNINYKQQLKLFCLNFFRLVSRRPTA